MMFTKGHRINVGRKRNPETNAKQSVKMKGRRTSPGTQFKVGHKTSATTRRRISRANRGARNGNYGKKLTEKQKQLMREGFMRDYQFYCEEKTKPRVNWDGLIVKVGNLYYKFKPKS